MSPTFVCAQSEEMRVLGQVNELLDQLNDDDIEQRDQAEAALKQLSPDALEFIDVPEADATTDYIDRLMRARGALEKKAIEQTLKPSVVSLESGVTINRALANIFKQTGNRIILAEDIALGIGNMQMGEAIDAGSFWNALDAVMATGNLEIDPYAGAAATIVLTHSGAVKPAVKRSPTSPNATAGMMQIAARRVSSTLSLDNPSMSFTTIELLTRWEPRVTPISIDLQTSTLKIVDDRGETVPLNKAGKISAVIQPEIPELSFPVNIPLVSRKVEQLAKINGTLQAVLPGRTETFTFSNLGDLEEGVEQTKSGATVTFHGYEINQDLYALTLQLSFDKQTNNVESHLSWAFDNEVELVSGNQRFAAVASETLMQRGQQLKVKYMFEQDPANFDLIYKTPAAIVKIDLDFELKDIPLP